MLDHLGQGPQPHAVANGAAPPVRLLCAAHTGSVDDYAGYAVADTVALIATLNGV